MDAVCLVHSVLQCVTAGGWIQDMGSQWPGLVPRGPEKTLGSAARSPKVKGSGYLLEVPHAFRQTINPLQMLKL